MMSYDEMMELSWSNNDTNNNIAVPYIRDSGVFSLDEIQKIREYFDTLNAQAGLVGVPGDNGYEYHPDHKLRKCSVTYAQSNAENSWFRERIELLMASNNSLCWDFDIIDFSQPMRQMLYGPTDHFNSWHMDAGPGLTRHRKLTSIVLLSEPDEYVGGELQISCYGTIDLKPGDMLTIPAFSMHRVLPITSGSRRSLVHRGIGPKFR